MSNLTTSKASSLRESAGRSSRASWAGQLSLGSLSIPVKAYPALVVPSAGPLHQVHMSCGQRLSQRKTCPIHGDVESTEIAKAFEYAPTDHLVLSEDELKSLAATDDHTIRIQSLLAPNQFDFTLLSGRSMYLGAAHIAALPELAMAVAILHNRGAFAIGSMVLSDVRRPVAVRSNGQDLLLYVLHFPEHRRANPCATNNLTTVSAQELRTAERAMLSLYKSFSWSEYRDESVARLNDLIAVKIAQRNHSRVKANSTPSHRNKRKRARQAA